MPSFTDGSYFLDRTLGSIMVVRGITKVSEKKYWRIHYGRRAYVMRQGKIAAELDGTELEESNILPHFFNRAA
jgi:hypothetical protein